MKMLGKTNDGVMDNLLRHHIKRRSRQGSFCQGFDPDLASAYIEHNLTAKEQQRYELHLSACDQCRASVVALTRLAEADAPAFTAKAAAKTQRDEKASPFLLFRGGFTRMASSPWAIAAAAVIILAISVPVLFLRGTRQASETNVAGQPSEQSEAKAIADSRLSQDTLFNKETAQRSPAATGQAATNSAAKKDAKGEQQQEGEVAVNQSQPPSPLPVAVVTEQAAPDTTQVAKAAENQPSDTDKSRSDKSEANKSSETNKSEDAKSDSTQNSSGTQAPAPASSAESKLAQIDPEKPLKLPQEDKDAASVSVLKRGSAGGLARPEREREATITSRDAQAPSTGTSTGEMGARKLLASPPPKPRAREKNNKSDRTGGSAERKVAKKTFWLKNDTWVDKDYDEAKELPVVPLVRDSDSYKDVLAKNSGLKIFFNGFTGFTEKERVIIVYKGIVYKLVPKPE